MYQGEPGEEFGGHLTPMNVIDPSMRHRFAPDDDQVNGRNPVGAFALQNEPHIWR